MSWASPFWWIGADHESISGSRFMRSRLSIFQAGGKRSALYANPKFRLSNLGRRKVRGHNKSEPVTETDVAVPPCERGGLLAVRPDRSNAGRSALADQAVAE